MTVGVNRAAPAAHELIHPVITSAPSGVRKRRRNELSGWTHGEKPISSTVVVIKPDLVWISSVPASEGMIWPGCTR
jgi:hypothetical protein